MITIKLSKTNCYLIQLTRGYLLVDTGYEDDYELFFNELNRKSIDIADIKFVFLTHHHDDHSGLLNDIIQLNSSIQIIMNNVCSELLITGENSRKYGGAWCCKNMKVAAEIYQKINRKWTLSFPPYTCRSNDILLDNNDVDLTPLVGIDLKSIYSPGHSIDSISLLDSDMNLFCGDAAADYLRFLGTKYVPPFVSDLNQLYYTWQRFIDIGVKTIYPSHGKPINISKIKKNIFKLTLEKMGEFVWV